jgi:hypothetical protein
MKTKSNFKTLLNPLLNCPDPSPNVNIREKKEEILPCPGPVSAPLLRPENRINLEKPVPDPRLNPSIPIKALVDNEKEQTEALKSHKIQMSADPGFTRER